MATSTGTVSRVEEEPVMFTDVEAASSGSLQHREVEVHVEAERQAVQPLSPRLLARMEAHHKALEELSSAQTALSKARFFKGSERRRVSAAQSEVDKYKFRAVEVGQSKEAPVHSSTHERVVPSYVDAEFHSASSAPFDLKAEKKKLVEEGRASIQRKIDRVEASLRSRYLSGTGLNKAANREKLQLINLREELALYDHDHLPETSDVRVLADRVVERENIVIRARNARTQLNADINLIGGSIIAATSAVALFATNYIANMYGYGF